MMKGEQHTVEEPNKHANMFTSLHRHPHQHHHHHQWQSSTPDEDEISRSTTTTTTTKRTKTIEGSATASGGAGGGGDGATIEVVRRPRGRPPGSKNKPKPPVVITRDTDRCAMRPHVLEIPAGVDIVESIVRFARHRNFGLCVLSGTGSIANVSLRQPSTTPGATVTFHGRFDILSISATYLPSSPSSSPSSSPLNGFAISLAGPQGQIFGGSVIGALIAVSTVFIVATTFSSPSYHRLPVEEEDEQQQQGLHHNHPNSSGGGGAAHTSTSSDGEERAAPPQETETCGMSLYSGHLPSDVIWVPTARQPPPPPPF